MNEGLNRVAKWSSAVGLLAAAVCAICYWGFGLRGSRSGADAMTLGEWTGTEWSGALAGVALLVACYCWTHANNDDGIGLGS